MALADRLVARELWGARAPKASSSSGLKKGQQIHWTASPKASSLHHPGCYDQVKGMQRFHMDTRKWSDIAYNFVVCNHGFVFAGRGWGVRNGASGTADGNANYLAVASIAGPGDPINSNYIEAIRDIVTEHVDKHGGGDVQKPHSFFKSTACPGPDLTRLASTGMLARRVDDAAPSTPAPTPPPVGPPPVVVPPIGDVSILDLSDGVSILDLQAWARKRGASVRFVELAQVAWEESRRYDVTPAVTYGLMAHETGFGGFGGVLNESFHNWGGIKTTKGGANSDPNAHQRFDSDREGVRAVVQHLALYAGLTIPADEVVDPRHFEYLRGQATTVTALSNRWAGAGYGDRVLKKVREILDA